MVRKEQKSKFIQRKRTSCEFHSAERKKDAEKKKQKRMDTTVRKKEAARQSK